MEFQESILKGNVSQYDEDEILQIIKRVLSSVHQLGRDVVIKMLGILLPRIQSRKAQRDFAKILVSIIYRDNSKGYPEHGTYDIADAPPYVEEDKQQYVNLPPLAEVVSPENIAQATALNEVIEGQMHYELDMVDIFEYIYGNFRDSIDWQHYTNEIRSQDQLWRQDVIRDPYFYFPHTLLHILNYNHGLLPNDKFEKLKSRRSTLFFYIYMALFLNVQILNKAMSNATVSEYFMRLFTTMKENIYNQYEDIQNISNTIGIIANYLRYCMDFGLDISWYTKLGKVVMIQAFIDHDLITAILKDLIKRKEYSRLFALCAYVMNTQFTRVNVGTYYDNGEIRELVQQTLKKEKPSKKDIALLNFVNNGGKPRNQAEKKRFDIVYNYSHLQMFQDCLAELMRSFELF